MLYAIEVITMKKKIAFYGLIIVILIVLLTFIYILIKPKKIQQTIAAKIVGEVEYTEIETFVYEKETEIYFFFFSSNDADSDFVVSKFILPLQEKYKITDFPNLYYVDLANLEEKKGTADKYLRNHFGFTRYPTFAVISIDSEGTNVEDLLEWQPTEPYTLDLVEQWLQEHKIVS